MNRLGDIKIRSVMQAVDAIWNIVDRDRAKVVVIGHAQIEEGQSHSNFKGDRFARFQMLVPAKSGVDDDKFRQYNRLETQKARDAGIECLMFTHEGMWEDNKRSVDWIDSEISSIISNSYNNQPIPHLNKLKNSFTKSGDKHKFVDPDYSDLIPFTKLHPFKFLGAREIIELPKGQRNGPSRALFAAAREEFKGKFPTKSMRLCYKTEDENLENKWYFTEEKPRDDSLIIDNPNDPNMPFIVEYLIPRDEYSPIRHKKESPSGGWWAPKVLVSKRFSDANNK